MATLSPEQIYGMARQAGFSPDQATTMTAIAMAESRGNTGAHNNNNEDSVGLWQINRDAHGDKFGDLTDPLQNAKAAFAVSGGGDSISPWTVTHAGRGSPYLQYKEEAQAAALAHGEPGTGGMWNGSPGYGNTVSAGLDDDGGAFTNKFAAPGSGADPDIVELGTEGGPSAEKFVQLALAQEGDEYEWGIEAPLSETDPDEFDCAELVEWAAGQVGIDMGEVSYYQYTDLRAQGGEISVEDAINTRGALLFRFGEIGADGLPASRHVAISLGDGRTIEAKGEKYGVVISDAHNGYTAGAIIPQLDYGAAPAVTLPASAPGAPNLATMSATTLTLPQTQRATAQVQQPAETGTTLTAAPPVPPVPPPPAPLDPNSPDTDRDGLTDSLEQRYKLDINSADTDGDTISDGDELSKYGSNPLKRDTDRDGLLDSTEIALGTDVRERDSDGDGRIDSYGLLVDPTDSDGDLLSDELELALQTITGKIDSDNDGFSDWLEFQAGTDPMSDLDNPFTPAGGSLPPPLIVTPYATDDLDDDPTADDDDDDLNPANPAAP